MTTVRTLPLLFAAALIITQPVLGQGILSPTDPIIAIDFDISSRSNYPTNEGPFNLVDLDSGTKYLNFAQANSGIIISPINGAFPLRSMVLTTANDFEERDPASWSLWGTNDPIQSLDNSDGNGGENWTFIDSGDLSLPVDRFTDSDPVAINNSTAYSSYRLVFPTVRSDCANSMQLADLYFYDGANATGTMFLSFVDDLRAIHFPTPESRYPCAETPAHALDGDPNTKYLNFGKEDSGFIVTPGAGTSVVTSFQITTANDFDVRDPASWELYGTNEPIVSTDNGLGNGENWTLVDVGSVELPLDRLTPGPVVPVNNSTAYKSYRMVFPTLRDTFGVGADSIQFSEIQFFGTVATPGGDFNSDGFFDCFDVNGLVAEIVAGTNTPLYDLTGDGFVNSADLNTWLVNAGSVNIPQTGGNPYLPGDANLDGSVDGSDFGAWNANKFTSIAAWCSGDFNADGAVDGSDFGVWNANKFQSSDSAVVPEPGFALSWLLAALAACRVRRSK